MQDIQIKALKREEKSKKFRQNNPKVIPGVVYGKDQEPISLGLDSVELEKAFYEAGGNKIIDLYVGDAKKPIKTLFHEVQMDPVTNKPTHFDLYAVTLGQKMRTDIPIHVINTDHLEGHEGVLTTIQDAVEVEANPLNLPEWIEVDASSLQEIGDIIVLGDLKAGKDVEFTGDPEYAIIKLDAPREEEPEEEPEPVDAADVESEHGGESEEGEAEEGEASDSDEESKE